MSNGTPANMDRLKEAVQNRARERLGIRKDFPDWSLNDIRDFQTDLEEVCRSSVSEKWFYTHLKNDNEKLPRIDVLNLLSQYCGYTGWDDFTYRNPPEGRKTSPRKKVLWGVSLIVIGMVVLAFWHTSRQPVVSIRFIDAYTRNEVPLESLKLTYRNSNHQVKMNPSGLRIEKDTVWADGPYYKARGIYLKGAGDSLTVMMFPDDYALMLNYFSRSTSDEWLRREEQLMEAIHPEAQIFQSHPQYSGIELLNREEFIYRLILPVNSLKNLEIQDIVYKDNKIYRLRFIQNEDNEE